jgi:hypothetical protein
MIVVVLGAVTATYPEVTALLDAGFATSPTAPSAEALPDNAVSLYATRATERDAFAAVAGGDEAAAAVNVPTSFQLSAPPPAAVPVTAAAAAAAEQETGDTRGITRWLSVRNGVIVLVLALAAAFVLRRRAVKRRRAVRLARRKQRIAAMRSGGLTVVDGRYRPGMRVGPPLESHVRVRRLDDPGLDHLDTVDELDALDA